MLSKALLAVTAIAGLSLLTTGLTIPVAAGGKVKVQSVNRPAPKIRIRPKPPKVRVRVNTKRLVKPPKSEPTSTRKTSPRTPPLSPDTAKAIAEIDRFYETYRAKKLGDVDIAEFTYRLQALLGHNDLNAWLFIVMKEANNDANENKKYYLRKLQDYNNMGDALSDYLTDLTGKSQQFGTTKASLDTPPMSPDTTRAIAAINGYYETYSAKRPSDADITDFVRELETRYPGADVNVLVQTALRQSYLETSGDLENYAQKVKHFNDIKSEIREKLRSWCEGQRCRK